MSEVKWIKIVTDIFDDEKILLIESMPEADAIIVIWFKLLTLAGKTNNKGVFLISDRIPYTDEMLSTIFRRKLNIVRLALQTFEQFGMIKIIDNIITIPNWGKHQNFDRLELKNEYMKNYMRDYREKQKELVCNTNGKVNSKSNSKANVSEADIDKIREEKDKELDIDNISIDYAKIIDYLNNHAGTQYKSASRKTQDLIKARFNEKFTIDDFYKVIDNKCNDWLGTEWSKYLRPETLFGTKFENYLNQVSTKQKTSKTMVGLEDVTVDF